jgi:arabinose-5-phosphate isomerase
MVSLMIKSKFKKIANEVINTEINSLKKLKKSLDASFNKTIEVILNCKKGKVILSGVGKSGIIAKKISSTLASVGTPSFYVDASSCSHGDLGQISSNDVLILISNSGESSELKNIIQYANRNKNITLIGIVSKKNSLLYKASDIKILLPEVKEAGPGNMVPTSSTIMQLAIGDAIAISTMRIKKFGEKEFKRFHPSGSLGARLKTVEDLMLKGKKIPFISENSGMKTALKIITKKKLGVLVVQNSKKKTNGIITDGQLRRVSEKIDNFKDLKVKDVMTKNPISIDMQVLAAKALSLMNTKKITSLCVHNKNKKKTVGIIHIHNILESNIQ